MIKDKLMNYLSSWLTTVFFILFSFMVSAADIPADVEGTQGLDQLSCIDENTQNCINDACLTSDEIDCEDNCGKLAQQKCQEMMDD